MERVQELTGFIPSWERKPKPQVVEELASYSLETKRIPDTYYFVIRGDGKLISPQTGKLVEESVEKTSRLGQKESQALDRIQYWGQGKNEGLVFWISPPHPERSRFTKMVVSEITKEESEKRLFNRTLLLEINDQEALNLGRELSLFDNSNNYIESPESLRSQPIFINSGELDWVSYLDVRINDKYIWEKIRSGEDIIAKEEAIVSSGLIYEELFGKNYPVGYDDERVKQAVEKANELNLFGSLGGSCPPALLMTNQEDTAFGVFSKNAEKSFPCPECHKPIPSGRGITQCPHCGITKEEYGSKCD